MKAYQNKELEDFVSKRDMANLFHIYEDNRLDIPNNKVFNILRTLHFKDLADTPTAYFEFYRIQHGDTWPLISFKLYKTVELWWLIMKLNNVVDPFYEPVEDIMIRYVSIEEVNTILDTIRDS